jgi:hypothetical protein
LLFAKKEEGRPPRTTLSPLQISLFTHAVAQYINAQRHKYYERGKQLAFGDTWSRYFAAIDLERVRILEPGLERVDNPPFYDDLEQLGFVDLPNFTSMGAITFDDVVVFHDPLTPQLVFHELVHVTQYRLLGIEEFARLYVRGYLHGGYEGTPLEMNAYQLDGRFIMGGPGFNVEAEVKAWIDSKRF